MSQMQTLFEMHEEDKFIRMNGTPTLQQDEQGRLRYSAVIEQPLEGESMADQPSEDQRNGDVA